jgi:hypothetical protein
MSIVSIIGSFDLHRRPASLLLFALATAASGCGTPPQSTNTAATSGEQKTPAELLKSEQLWKYEGTGTEKRKVAISRRERVKLLHETERKTN